MSVFAVSSGESGLVVIYNNKLLEMFKLPYEGIMLGEKRVKYQDSMFRFRAQNLPPIGAHFFHSVGGTKKEEKAQRATEFSLAAQRLEILRQKGCPIITATGDPQEPTYIERDQPGKAKGTATSRADFEVNKPQLKAMAKAMRGTNLVLVAVQMPPHIVPKRRIPANGYLNPQAAKPKRGEIEFDSKTVKFVFVDRLDMTEAQAEAATNAVIDALTVPDDLGLFPFGKSFTHGSDHFPLAVAKLLAALPQNILNLYSSSVQNLIQTILNFNLTTRTQPLIGTDGTVGFKPLRSIYKEGVNLSDPFVLGIQHQSTLKLQQILTQALSDYSKKWGIFQNEVAQLEALLADDAEGLNYTTFGELIHGDFWTNFLLRGDPALTKDKLDEHLKAGGKAPNRDFLLAAVNKWVRSPEFRSAQAFLKKKYKNNLSRENAAEVVYGIDKDVIDRLFAKIGTEHGAGFMVEENYNPRDDQLFSLAELSDADICVLDESMEMTAESAATVRNAKFRGHLNMNAGMRKVAEIWSLKYYLNALPEAAQQELGYVKVAKRDGYNLDQRLNELRRMAHQQHAKQYDDFMPEILFGDALKPENEAIACALAFNSYKSVDDLESQLMRMTDGKLLVELNPSETTLIAGFLASYPDKREVMLNHLFKKVVSEPVKLDAYDPIFESIPELATKCAQVTLRNPAVKSNILLHPAVLANAGEQLAIVFTNKHTEALKYMQDLISTMPALFERLRMELRELEAKTATWFEKTFLQKALEKKVAESEGKQAKDIDVKMKPLNEEPVQDLLTQLGKLVVSTTEPQPAKPVDYLSSAQPKVVGFEQARKRNPSPTTGTGGTHLQVLDAGDSPAAAPKDVPTKQPAAKRKTKAQAGK